MNTDQLTFTRFIAAILIVIYHFGGDVFPFNHVWLAPFFHHSNLGVSYFFLLSGFVMVVAYGRKGKAVNYGNYLQNRAARILPLYYFAMLLMLLYFFIRISLLHVHSDYQPKMADVILHITLLQSWLPGKATTINTAAWSLSVEAFFYLLFPLFWNQGYSKSSFNKVLFFVSLFFVISQIVFHVLLGAYPQLLSYFFYLPLLHLNEFVCGNAVGLLLLKRKHIRKQNTFIHVLIVFMLSVLAVYCIPETKINFHNGLFVVFFAPLVYFLAVDNSALARTFRKKIFIYLGEISYGIYILQFPVYFFFTATLTYFGHKINQPLFFVYLLILVVVSGFSFRYIETPMREKIRSFPLKKRVTVL